MKNLSFTKYRFALIATILLWIKTYIVYKTSFDIEIESWKQEFILFINPLSFLLFVFGFSFFMKEKARNRYIIVTSFLTSFVLYANVMFYRFFNDFITLPVLFQTSNMGDLGNSVFELFRFTDLMMFADVVLLMWLVRKKSALVHFEPVTKKERRAYYFIVAAIALFNLGLAETERPELLTRTFDREMLVKNIGTYNYHIYDIVLQSKSKAQRALADSSELADIENYIRANEKAPEKELFGIAKNRNVIIVSMESLQSFVINNTINGQEITPFLNQFIKQSYYFDNFYHQTGQGKTSDAEFLIENSLYPLGRGAVFFTHATNEYRATPEILKKHGYYSAVFHANNKSFWNRDIMYQSLGYDKYFAQEYFDVNEENSVGWGLKDKYFFEQSIPYLKTLPQPFYTKFITLTNHFPFELEEEDKMVPEYTSNSRTLNRYFPTVRYMDESLKVFIERLKKEGLYENSIIILYGDHYGISENHNKAMAQYLGKEEITPFDHVQLQRVPLIIHIPGVTDKHPKVISKVSGQVDVKPTLLHLLGIDTKDDIHFGQDLFAKDKMDFAVLRDGSFITKDYVFKENICYDKKTGLKTDVSHCEPYMEKAKQELDYSDKIIYGDLLRFYDNKNKKIKETKQ
ncbi:phosphoglycerol transferase MdoB-like AlkP superfamily enzyme [Anoxybacillus calidus]|jgi:lipoteichoic acid synthase|uniref:Phosphoglycerol transferase MdoB-like AlkP superfamily enzyme n=1 Tax=[Anoxybacillus] calidus TaxID=575178 RepID=A0A7V9YWV9_9BACL|nr:LTA synthase family protein [Anoxybacillus calidus]MBA2869898.1 phosphoglycerol transferase MdoB-like AlkP superfamily enzyme [Anoxybacillus calidus]